MRRNACRFKAICICYRRTRDVYVAAFGRHEEELFVNTGHLKDIEEKW